MKKTWQSFGLFCFIVVILFLAAPWRGLFGGAQVATTHSVTLGWTASATTGVTYTVSRATSSAGPFTVIASGVTGTTFTDTTGPPGTQYFYEVDAISVVNGSTEDSGPSNVVNATEPQNPLPPTALQVVSVK